jgi:hypothetical protein
MAKIEYHNCDVCGVRCEKTGRNTPMVFNTETTEGRSCKPYLTTVSMDICDPCLQKLIDNFPLIASGAMGYNEYTWRIK